MAEQKSFAGLGSTGYVFRKDDFAVRSVFDDLKEKAVTLDAFPQQAIDALQSLSLAGLGSPDYILSMLIKENNRHQSIAREPAIPHNIFREFYFRVVKQNPVLDDNAMVLLDFGYGQRACVSGGLYKKMKKDYDNNKLR